jgi:hypothetical protein
MNVHLLTSNESKSTAVSTIQEQLLWEIKGHVVCKNLVEVTKGSEQTLWMARDATLAFWADRANFTCSPTHSGFPTFVEES